jgi:hypothetical protein
MPRRRSGTQRRGRGEGSENWCSSQSQTLPAILRGCTVPKQKAAAKLHATRPALLMPGPPIPIKRCISKTVAERKSDAIWKYCRFYTFKCLYSVDSFGYRYSDGFGFAYLTVKSSSKTQPESGETLFSYSFISFLSWFFFFFFYWGLMRTILYHFNLAEGLHYKGVWVCLFRSLISKSLLQKLQALPLWNDLLVYENIPRYFMTTKRACLFMHSIYIF